MCIRDRFFRFQQMVRDGVSLRQRTFAQAWKEWFNQIDGDGVCDRPPLSGPGVNVSLASALAPRELSFSLSSDRSFADAGVRIMTYRFTSSNSTSKISVA